MAEARCTVRAACGLVFVTVDAWKTCVALTSAVLRRAVTASFVVFSMLQLHDR